MVIVDKQVFNHYILAKMIVNNNEFHYQQQKIIQKINQHKGLNQVKIMNRNTLLRCFIISKINTQESFKIRDLQMLYEFDCQKEEVKQIE
jgi:hypothetical protein